jgi:hypothetical protein
MACFQWSLPEAPLIGVSPADFTAELVIGSGILSEDSGGWIVSPKPSIGSATVRFTPTRPLTISRIDVQGYAANLSSCDAISTIVVFVTGIPANLELPANEHTDEYVDGEVDYIDVTYEGTVSAITPWTIPPGQIVIYGTFEEPPLPKQLIIEDELGTIIHTRSLEAYDTGIYNFDYNVYISGLSGKLKIYTTGMFPDLLKIINITCAIPVTTKYQELNWSVGQPTMNLSQDLNWVIGPHSYNLATNLNWSTYPIQLSEQELNWGTRPNLERNIDIYYTISPTIEQELNWTIAPQIGQDINWLIGNRVSQDVNWSIANIIRPQISWSVTNDSVVADLNWSIRQWNPQDISWEIE